MVKALHRAGLEVILDVVFNHTAEGNQRGPTLSFRGVDGFRFDLASILSRDEFGYPMADPPVLWDIDTDPVLAGTKLIAEAWDLGGLYQVGSFAGNNWREWNGRFRDDVRSFMRGEERSVRALADRLLGSPGIYGARRREAEESVNFVTCHDGFTLNDLVSYSAEAQPRQRRGQPRRQRRQSQRQLGRRRPDG